GPGQVGQVNQTVDIAWQADEHAEVGDRLDRALDLVALLVGNGKVVPRIGLALLHAEADTTTLFVDFQNHDFDFVAQLNDLVRCNVLVGPVHFGNVHQAFDTLFDFDECAVVG